MDISTAQAFGAAIRNRRKAMHITQSYLSEFTGFSVSFISDLEHGKKTIELEKALFLANTLGLTCQLTPRDE